MNEVPFETTSVPPKFSVVIPVYNVENYLNQCLESVISQTISDIEIICVNDGSTDRSLEVLREFEQKDSRVKVIDREHKGAGTARNTGLRYAHGTYLALLDADDFFEPEMLEECYRTLEKDKSDIVIFTVNRYDDKTKEVQFLPRSIRKEFLPSHVPFSPTEIKERLFNSFQNWAWNKIFRRSFIEEKGIRFQDVIRTNDMAFTCEALAKAELISIIDKPFVCHRVGSGTNLQATNHLAPGAFWDAYLETKRRLEEAGLYQTYRQSFLNWILHGSLYNMHSNKTEYGQLYVSGLLKYRGEADFGFAAHDRDYYYDQRQYDAYISILKADTPELVSELRQKNVKAETACQNKLASMQKEYQEKSARMQKKYQMDLEKTKKEYREDTARMQEKNQLDLEKAKKEYLEDTARMRENYQLDLEKTKKEYQADLYRIRAEYRRRLNSSQKECQKAKDFSDALQRSTSFKIGSAITLIPGTIKRKLKKHFTDQ